MIPPSASWTRPDPWICRHNASPSCSAAAEQGPRQIAVMADGVTSVAQPVRNAGQAWATASSVQPESCAKGTGRSIARAASRLGPGAGGGSVVHAAASSARENRQGSHAMVWFFIEAGVALLLAIFIVWFTMGGKRKPPPPTPHNNGKH